MPALPKPLQDVVDRLAGLPGLGPKSALRAALLLLKWPRERAEGLGQSILELRDKLCLCSECASLAETDPCPICSDPTRDEEKLCLVSDWDSLLVMEEAGLYRGRYLVLGGLIAPLDGVTPAGLEFPLLQRKLTQGRVKEVILALGTMLEAETTASYVKDMLGRLRPDVRLCRLAQGIPLGSDLKYVDRETLKQSLIYRQDI